MIEVKGLFAAASAFALLATPAAAQDTLQGLGRVQGYSDSPFDTTRARYDLLVDGSRPADPARHRYGTIADAYAAAPEGTREKPTVIGILPGVYQLGGTADDTGLRITKPNLTLIGLTRDRRAVVLADNRGNRQGANNNGFSIMVDADGFSAMNLTILNYCNVDYDYPGDPTKSLRRRSSIITQAVAIQMKGDRHAYSHVAFLSRLDTMFNMTKRSYFTHSYLEGTDDYLGAPGASVWEDSEINFAEGGGILFAGGTTFIRTRFRATKPMQFYKVPVAPVALIDSILPDVPIAWFGWRAPASTAEPSLTWRTRTESGRRPDIVDSFVGPERRTIGRELTEAEARAFNPWNLLRRVPDGAEDGWDPAGARVQYASAGGLPNRLRLLGTPARIRTGEPPLTLSATASPPGSTTRIRWSTPSLHVRLGAAEGDSVRVTAANHTGETVTVPIEARTDNGFLARASVTVDPPLVPAPVLTVLPTLRLAGASASVTYALTGLGQRRDRSAVTWFACDEAACLRPEVVAVSLEDRATATLPLPPALAGRWLTADVAPQSDLSLPGPSRRSAAVRVAPMPAPSATVLDLRSLPDTTVKDRWTGEWRLTGSWTGEAPLDGGTAWGLRAGREDSTILYVGRPSAGDMDLLIAFDTDKLEGQGFSIAGSPADDGRPRGDLLFKYDPVTRSGYSVRFWRSTRSATAVVFQLYRISAGKGTPLGSEDQLTGVLKPTTTLRVQVRDERVLVRGDNTSDEATLRLAGTIQPNAFGGAGLYWTASGYGGSVVVRRFELAYPAAGDSGAAVGVSEGLRP